MPFQLERQVLFRLGPAADYVREQSQFKNTEAKAVQRVCSFVGTKGLVELEKLATVAWIRSREQIYDTELVAILQNSLPPHLPGNPPRGPLASFVSC